MFDNLKSMPGDFASLTSNRMQLASIEARDALPSILKIVIVAILGSALVGSAAIGLAGFGFGIFQTLALAAGASCLFAAWRMAGAIRPFSALASELREDSEALAKQPPGGILESVSKALRPEPDLRSCVQEGRALRAQASISFGRMEKSSEQPEKKDGAGLISRTSSSVAKTVTAAAAKTAEAVNSPTGAAIIDAGMLVAGPKATVGLMALRGLGSILSKVRAGTSEAQTRRDPSEPSIPQPSNNQTNQKETLANGQQ